MTVNLRERLDIPCALQRCSHGITEAPQAWSAPHDGIMRADRSRAGRKATSIKWLTRLLCLDIVTFGY